MPCTPGDGVLWTRECRGALLAYDFIGCTDVIK